MGQHGSHTGTVHPPQTALVTHPNSIKKKNRSYYLLCTTEFTCSPPRLLTDAALPVPALETGNTFKVLLPHDLHLTRAEPVLSASPSLHSCPVFSQPWPRHPSIWFGRRERPGGLGERSLSLLKSFPATFPCLLLGLFVVNHFPCRMKYVSPWSLETYYTALKSLGLCP